MASTFAERFPYYMHPATARALLAEARARRAALRIESRRRAHDRQWASEKVRATLAEALRSPVVGGVL